MAGLPKSIIAKWGMTKRAWAEYRKSKKGRKTSPKKHKRHARPKRAKAHRKTRKPSGHTTAQKGVAIMAKKRKRSFRGRARRIGRRVRVSMETRPGKMVMAATEAAAGAVASSLVVNKVPVIKDQNATIKGLGQVGLGMVAVFFSRNRHVRAMGSGSVIAGIMSLVKTVTKIDPLAGPSAGARTLTPSEMRALTRGQMNMPLPMNAPLHSAPANAGFSGGFGN